MLQMDSLELNLWLSQAKGIEALCGTQFFLGLPERWLDEPRWRCLNGHVSRRYLKSEEHGDLCLACEQPVRLTFPEDEFV